MQEFFSVSLILTQHINRRLGRQSGVTLSKVSRYKREVALEENHHILLCDLGGTLGIDQEYIAPRNPSITSMNYMGYNFGVFNHQDMSNISHLRRTMSFSKFPWMNCNITHPMTKEPFFGEPYEIYSINGMKLAILGGYGGSFRPEAENENPTIHVSSLGSSAKRWLRYIYDTEDPDYVIVCISDADDEISDIVQDMEGVGLLITGSCEDENIEENTYETFSIEDGQNIPRYHHHHTGKVMHVELSFKTRTTTYEFLSHSVARIDREISQLSDDQRMLDLVHYHL
ncbi:hypothetical protein ACFOLA_11450 [Salinicoccus hispanicus]|uniref:Bifunctional metallophosphatase/5'-nucleotidase n=1 Tax=Salinicoccus hispanicus TaxID=157225 RepID=A0A6N8U3W3_9STAP|nr:hypothetical protein [Salinicoccus hispanicus]MXQ50911.1 hypothetical protein [Salinicoccus hispanicus]